MVKVISLSEEAYSTLKELKEKDESFSHTVVRLAAKKGNIMKLFGCAKKDKEFIEGLNKAHNEREENSLRVY